MPKQAKSLKTPQDKKIVVWIPFLKTTMQINEKDFNPEWMIKEIKEIPPRIDF